MRNSAKYTLLKTMSAIALFTFSAGTTFVSLKQTPFANGWDGYYYLIQVKSWFEKGAFHSPDISPVYWMLILFQKVTGDYVLSLKALSAVTRGLFTAGIFFVSMSLLKKQLTGNAEQGKIRKVACCASVAALSAMGPTGFYYASQFPKNLLGMVFLVFFIVSMENVFGEKTGADKTSIKRLLTYITPLILFILSFITHRFSGMMAGFVCLCYFFQNVSFKINFKALTVLIFAIFLIFFLSVFFPGTLHFYDLDRMKNFFSARPQIAPCSLISLLGSFKFGLIWKSELFLYYFLVIISALMLFLNKLRTEVVPNLGRFIDMRIFNSGIYTIILLTCLFSIFPFSVFDLEGVSYRLYLSGLIISPVLLLPLLNRLPAKFITMLIIAAGTLTMKSMFSYNPDNFDPPYALYRKISAMAVDGLAGEKYDLIVAHKGLAEILTFENSVDALPWEPEERFKRDRVWRIAAGIPLEKFCAILGDETFMKHYKPLKGDYSLLREDEWEKFKTKSAGDKELSGAMNSWRNPSIMRPKFVTKGR